MVSAKTLYWASLGLLTLSFVSTHNLGLRERVREMANVVCVRTVPLRALAELTFGHAQASQERLQAAEARLAESQARMQAQQMRMQAALTRAQVKQVMVANKVWKAKNAVNVTEILRENGIPDALDCPETRVHIVAPEIDAPEVTVSQDPI
jgi:hypothetical protein